jgi:hypothetical protein
MVGYFVGHMVDGDYIEPAIDWSSPILRQRKYMMRQHQYDKPLLTKTGIRYKPGFHNKYLPLTEIPQDPDIYLMHLKEFDSTFCADREKKKFDLIRK